MVWHRSRVLKIAVAAVFVWILFYTSPRLFLHDYVPNILNECSCNVNISAEPSPIQAPLQPHYFRPDGLVEVNLAGNHPIFELIARAEKEWDEKLKRASTTLDEAVAEYRRRYRRDPPKGFDDWWRYVEKHNIQLPDEYDQIYHDLEPFWGLEPPDMWITQHKLESKKDSFTIGKTDTEPLGVLTTAFEEGRYNQLIHHSKKILELLREVEEFLPNFRATFSPHDGPNMLTDFEVKAATLAAAKDQKYLSSEELPKINKLGWVSACSPTSPARLRKINLEEPLPAKHKKTFIHDHRLSMDPCLHPELLWSHGQFLSHYYGPSYPNYGPDPQETMVPFFAPCTSVIHHNIHIPTPYGWVEDVDGDPSFDDKIDERLLWRGSSTGMYHSEKTRWQNSQRITAVRTANELNGTIDVLSSPQTDEDPLGPPKSVRKARLNPAVMDIAFAGMPHQCGPESYCEYLATLFPWREKQSLQEASRYKYILDVDGNGWSGRFKRLITSNSLVFKATIYPEWYHDRVAPWVHYVPVQVDLSDLHDALLFFRGDANGEGAHEDLAKKIAMQGRHWSKKFWRKEDLVAYFFRLILEYKRLMSPDRAAMSYKGDGSVLY